ncbi:hypothetical protein BH18ACI4_BH18ACI4_09730 [soil metagenome]
MPRNSPEAPAPSFNVHNILSALFKHKKKILLLGMLGLGAACAFYLVSEPVFQSNATLLVRYVLDRSIVDQVDGTVGKGPRTNDTIIDAEVQILKSWDLAVQVAQALGPKRVIPDSAKEPTVNDAAGTILGGLTVTTKKASNIIAVSYKNAHADVASLVLNELITRYFTKHLEVHRSAGAFDFVNQQADQVRMRLNQIEDALKTLKGKAGFIALPESVAALGTELSRLNEQLSGAESELAEQRARVNELEQARPAGSAAVPAATPAPQPTLAAESDLAEKAGAVPAQQIDVASSLRPEASPPKASSADVERYQGLVLRVAQLRKLDLELSSKYTLLNPLVRANQEQIGSLESEKKGLERKFPGLANTALPESGTSDFSTERARLAGLEAKAAMLRSRLTQLTEIAPQITDLKRNQELEETSYKYFKGTLEKARVDEALDPTKMPNISAVQKPSPPSRVTKARNKVVLGLAGGGLALGIAFALLRELLLNKTVQRPLELENQLHTPLLLSIPYLNGSRRLRLKTDSSNGVKGKLIPRGRDHSRTKVAPWDVNHFIRPYAEAIRDRLSLYFELNGLTHKPKLVGITGLSAGAGASTLAAGLAAALSELGDGKVLLVNVNMGPEEVHQFFKGRPALPLPAALKPAAPTAAVAENLYLATANSSAPGPAQLGLKKFFELMPNMKASDFDYIIFDMPPLTDTSPTFGIAGFLDRTLLITEAEKSNRDFVKRRYLALAGNRDNVSIILNKTRSYTPKWLDGES